jgi:hypothetical protein
MSRVAARKILDGSKEKIMEERMQTMGLEERE